MPLPILMLLYGYLTVDEYDEHTGSVTLRYPNLEIEEALRTRYEEYMPKDGVFITSKCKAEAIWHLDNQMKMGDVAGALQTLKNFGFPVFTETLLRREVDKWDVTKRLVVYIRAALLICRESVTFLKPMSREQAGDIDAVTVGLETNFIFELKKERSALECIEQLIKYLHIYPHSFKEAAANPTTAYFVGVNFRASGGGRLDEWISIPYEDGKLKYDLVQASSPLMAGQVKEGILITKTDEGETVFSWSSRSQPFRKI